jgi:hypothetical protein
MVFLVLGLPRSGTSAVAGLLHRLGVHMGDDLDLAKHVPERPDLPEWNPAVPVQRLRGHVPAQRGRARHHQAAV